MADQASTAGKGKPFFDRADQVAGTANWDYAIEMYIQGISREPENVERGLNKLRDVALTRQANGGKPAGFMEKLKHKKSKDPQANLASCLWLMSRDPSNLSHWKDIIQAAQLGQWPAMMKWAVDSLFGLNQMSGKPSKDVYLFITDACEKAELYSDAVRSCQMALQTVLEKGQTDAQLEDRLRDLSARETIQKGRYDTATNFTESVKDLKGQIDLNQKDQMVQSEDFLLRQIEQAREGYLADPDQPSKVNALVDALLKIEDESYENEAIDVLTKAHKDSGVFRFKMRIGDIKIRQVARQRSKLQIAGDKEGAVKFARRQLEMELAEYAERAENYPTDLNFKYELGKRLFVAGRYDDAIAALQQARRDPKHRITAVSLLGQSFYKKEWYNEAADTFSGALELTDLTENRRKELMYCYGLVLEAQEKTAEALEQYSDVAQLDFNYRDVRARIEKLRK